MSDGEHFITTVFTALPEGSCLGEILLFPEVCTHGTGKDWVGHRLRRLAERILQDTPLGEWSRRIEVDPPTVREIQINVAPRENLVQWQSPLPVRLPIVAWKESDRHHVGYLPSLMIEVVGRNEDELLERATTYARLLVTRMGVSRDLRLWARLARRSDVRIGQALFVVDPPTALDAAKQLLSDDEDHDRCELDRSATNLLKLKLEPAFEVESSLNRLADLVNAPHAGPVLLVGPSGVGKTALIHELVRQRRQFGLANRPIWQTDGPRLVAGMTGFGMWQQRCMKIVEEARRSNAILILGNLVELMQVGRHEGNEQGIASFFKPYLARGDIQVIAECTLDQRQLIDMQDPHMLSIFEEMPLQEPDAPQRLRILNAVASQKRQDGVPSISRDALRQLDDLHERFATYSVAPGRPLRFLMNLIQSATDKQAIAPTP